MAPQFPYARYVCPCTDINESPAYFNNPKDAETSQEAPRDEQSFNPNSSRANYALYPIENLLFCNECHELRCPRCYYEEALNYYCPSCLFEILGSVIKTETNRCTRSCFQCPICTTTLSISPYPNAGDEPQPGDDPSAYRERPCILSCQWCHWTSLEIDIVFEKATNLSGQLAKMKLSGEELPHDEVSASQPDLTRPSEISDFGSSTRIQKSNDQYSQLASFYKNQISETNPSGPFGISHNFGLDSPSQLSRLLTTYGVAGLKKQKDQLNLMREALDRSEGLRPEKPDDPDDDVIAKMQTLGWDGTSSMEQIQKQTSYARFVQDLRPISIQLRSRRSKRCRTCRHNLVKLNERAGRWKYQIKLIAANFIPKISLRPLDYTIDLDSLSPLKTVQILLTFHNPQFNSAKVTLATSPTTLGKVRSKITILCPQFDIGANTDVWDEALDTTNVERRRAKDALEGVQAEAGKIWEKGRNWTSVIMETVPGNPDLFDKDWNAPEVDESMEKEDSILEIPLFVHLEYETDETSGDTLTEDVKAKGSKEKTVKRELSYWCILGAGRINSTIE